MRSCHRCSFAIADGANRSLSALYEPLIDKMVAIVLHCNSQNRADLNQQP